MQSLTTTQLAALPEGSLGQGAAPFKTVQDYENNLKRHKEFIVLMDRSIDRFRQGMASGVFETKMTITNVVDQLNTQLAQSTEESPYFGPVKKFPEGFSDADKARLTAEYRDIIEKLRGEQSIKPRVVRGLFDL